MCRVTANPGPLARNQPLGYSMSILRHNQTSSQTPRFIGVQYRTINIKTVSEAAVRTLLESCKDKPGARMAWVQHPAQENEGGETTPAHFHFCASFTSPVRLSDALRILYEADPHNYCKPCRNFRASVRYLAHLDNPEKVQIDPAQIALAGDWDGVNLQTLFERKGATADLGRVLRALADYLQEHQEEGTRVNRVRFALWLDSHGYNSCRAFVMLNQLGVSLGELARTLRDDDDVLRDARSRDIPAPPASV